MNYSKKLPEFQINVAAASNGLVDIKKQNPSGGGTSTKVATAPLPPAGTVAAAAPPIVTAPPIANLVAPPGRRVALVVGNAFYRHMPSLQNPKNDAADVERALKSLGFETLLATDLDRSGMNSVVERFSRLVQGADVAIIYYSGHGMQFAGKNYLLPTDANLESSADVNRYRLLPVDDLVEMLGLSNGLQLIVLDACRNNPVEKDFKNRVASAPGGNRDVAATKGFTRMDARSGLIITYATAPNDVAADGQGRNSPFTQAFLKNIAAPDMDIRQVLFRVQSEVYSSSGRQQLPEISSLYVGPEVRLKSSQK
ncbi:caspase family protein [Bradyrhizobium cenepequi]